MACDARPRESWSLAIPKGLCMLLVAANLPTHVTAKKLVLVRKVGKLDLRKPDLANVAPGQFREGNEINWLHFQDDAANNVIARS